MSWLGIGRRNDDEEDDDEEYSDEEEEYSSSEEEGEEDEKHNPEEEPETSKSEDKVELEKPTEEPDPVQNGHPPPDEPPKLAEKVEAPPEAAPETPDDTNKQEDVKAPEPERIERDTAEPEEPNSVENVGPAKDVAATAEEKEPEPAVKETPRAESPKEEENQAAENEEKPTENGDVVSEKKDDTATTTTDKEEAEAKPEQEKHTPKSTDETTEESKTEGEGEEEDVTSTHEKRSLLVLAAEHDRVDILKAILADDSEDRDTLLNSSIPPLHISIAYGSSNAVQCLLRMGADPSVRPDIEKIKEDAEAEGEEQLVDIPHMGRFDKLSAWELAFGKADQEEKILKKKGSWFGGGDKKSIDIAPSKLEGIRHAFTAEGLRCIGSDEMHRLKQLIDSGMPSTIDIGGKNLYDWAVEMGALQCEELLRPAEADRNSKEEANSNEAPKGDGEQQTSTESGSSAVLDRIKPGNESLSQLDNRIDELENLSKALSSCLDNLAEEVSVCHGLLLMGGGASALASHVRSLKTLKENKIAELDRLEEAWENSEDELAYWVKECGESGREIAELMSPAIISSTDNEHKPFEGSPEEEQAHRQQLKAQAALLENKIRKLRASITDLSDESTRDLEEVENRGLSGGIKLVRSLRDEIREVEFALNETRSAESLCRAKIMLIQHKMGQGKKQSTSSPKPSAANGQVAPVSKAATEVRQQQVGGEATNSPSQAPVANEPRGEAPASPSSNGIKPEQPTSTTPVMVESKPRPSESIATGQSSAIALKNKSNHGYFTVDLWRILLRIIGLGSSSRPMTPSQSSASNVMIV